MSDKKKDNFQIKDFTVFAWSRLRTDLPSGVFAFPSLWSRATARFLATCGPSGFQHADLLALGTGAIGKTLELIGWERGHFGQHGALPCDEGCAGYYVDTLTGENLMIHASSMGLIISDDLTLREFGHLLFQQLKCSMNLVTGYVTDTPSDIRGLNLAIIVPMIPEPRLSSATPNELSEQYHHRLDASITVATSERPDSFAAMIQHPPMHEANETMRYVRHGVVLVGERNWG